MTTIIFEIVCDDGTILQYFHIYLVDSNGMKLDILRHFELQIFHRNWRSLMIDKYSPHYNIEEIYKTK